MNCLRNISILPILIRSRFQQVESCIWLIDRIPGSESEELLQNFRSNQAPKNQILHKIDFLVQESGEAAVDVMRTIKHALDPHNIFNPGKVLRW